MLSLVMRLALRHLQHCGLAGFTTKPTVSSAE